jgi:hypothetical protein
MNARDEWCLSLVNMLCLENSDGPVCQTGLPNFGRQNIYFSCFNFCELLIMCIMYYLFTNIIIAPTGCIYIGGALLNFLDKCAKWHL